MCTGGKSCEIPLLILLQLKMQQLQFGIEKKKPFAKVNESAAAYQSSEQDWTIGIFPEINEVFIFAQSSQWLNWTLWLLLIWI